MKANSSVDVPERVGDKGPWPLPAAGNPGNPGGGNRIADSFRF